MAFDERARVPPKNSGPFIAVITNHNDPLKMGRLEVALIDGMQNSTTVKGETYVAKYLSPFSGATSVDYEGSDASKFSDVQKSYGFWMIPPDIGSRVMVIFAQQDPNQCYWIGSVQDTYQNYMIPGIAASSSTYMTSEQQQKYSQATYLPVGEYNKKTELLKDPRIDQKPKPVHPFADRLLQQGLLMDPVRGPTSSSARRETPSQVYGISTPGPLDPKGPVRAINGDKNVVAPVSRLGGSTFVMDDGDVNGQNELVRIRTRTGHQILLHNTNDLIYIGNSTGTTWLEMTSHGKIDIFAQDSISIHTEGDFNFRADRDFNLEAGRNFKITTMGSNAGDVSITSGGNLNVTGTKFLMSSPGDFNLSAGGNMNLHTGGTYGLSSKSDINLLSGKNSNLTATSQFNIKSGSKNVVAITAGTDISLNAKDSVTVGNTTDSPPVLYTDNSRTPTVADAATAPTVTKPISPGIFSVPVRDVSKGWQNGNLYNGGTLLTTMQRVPMHEPWDQHEDVNRLQFSLAYTDAGIGPSVRASNGSVIPAGPSANTPYPAQAGPGIDNGVVRGQKFPWSTDQPFLEAVKNVAEGFNFDPLDLLAAMWNETGGTYDPAIKNPLGSATGLIQFLESTANSLGTTTAQLAQMTRPQQMQYVQKYFSKSGWPSGQAPNPTIANIYMTIFLPKFKFAAPTTVIADGTPGSPTYQWYAQNSGFDVAPKQGVITPAMVAAKASLRRISVVNCLTAAGVGLVKGKPDYFVVPAPSTPNAGTPVRSSDGTIVTDGSGNPVTTAPTSSFLGGP